jgi:hypothetical protein
VRWGQAEPAPGHRAVADRVFRSDIYRSAASELALACPIADRKVEGAHADPWILPTNGAPLAMAPDDFLDGSIFDSSNAEAQSIAPKTRNAGEQQDAL